MKKIEKLLILFGSKSDEVIYNDLTSMLKKENINFELFVASAHRNPEMVRDLLANKSYDGVVAGAGLAAHLPGVCASLTEKLVIGLPVNSQFEGIDAFLSILQMPKGKPVLTAGVGQTNSIASWVTSANNLSKWNLLNIVNHGSGPFSLESVERIKSFFSGQNLEIFTNDIIVEDAINVNVFDLDSINNNQNISKKPNHLSINLFALPTHVTAQSENVLKVFKFVNKSDSLWLGVNQFQNVYETVNKIKKIFKI